jgi:hypothetical protein
MLPNSVQRSRLLFRQLRPRIRPWSEVWLFDSVPLAPLANAAMLRRDSNLICA